MIYFELNDRTESSFVPFVPPGTNIRRPGGCRECGTMPSGASPPDVLPIEIDAARNTMISHTGWGFGVIAIELLSFLGSDAAEHLKLGRLANPNAELIDNFRTFVGVERIVFRGDQESKHHVCKTCGALVYTYLPRESPYVTSPQIASNRAVYEIESMQLLINEPTRERMADRWSGAIKFYETPVLETPLDALPANIGLWPTPQQLSEYKPNLPKGMKN